MFLPFDRSIAKPHGDNSGEFLAIVMQAWLAQCGTQSGTFERHRERGARKAMQRQQFAQRQPEQHVTVHQHEGLIDPAWEALVDRAYRARCSQQLWLV
jgi:hypothetical protein